MRRVIINMKDFVFADAVAQALCADKKSDFEVQKTTSPGEIEKYGIILSPYAVLMEVTAASPYTLEKRLKTGAAVKEENRQCKIVLLVDENSEKQVADQVRQAKKNGSIDQFFYGSISASYLVALMDGYL